MKTLHPDNVTIAQRLQDLRAMYVQAKKFLILHHDDMDGFAAGAAALSFVQGLGGVPAENIKTAAVQYAPAEELKAKFLAVTADSDEETAVFILDFSYDRETLDFFADPANKRCRTLLVLDHHKTAEEALRDAPYAFFDMSRSGALLAFNYFFPHLDHTEHHILTCIDNRDLWKGPLCAEHEVHSYLLLMRSEHGSGFMKFMQRMIFETNEDLFDNIRAHGAILMSKTRSNLKSVLRSQIKTTLNGEPALVVFSAIDQSELGEALYSQEGMQSHMAVTVTLREDLAIFSLRSHKGHGPDVSKIASLMGGGGHANAAGFTCHPRKAWQLVYGGISRPDETPALPEVGGN